MGDKVVMLARRKPNIKRSATLKSHTSEKTVIAIGPEEFVIERSSLVDGADSLLAQISARLSDDDVDLDNAADVKRSIERAQFVFQS